MQIRKIDQSEAKIFFDCIALAVVHRTIER